MLNDSAAPLRRRFLYSGAPSPWRGDTAEAYTEEDMKRYMKINTHRQHGRIVQSHHRILCNNPNCRRSSISLSLRLAFSPSLRACVTSPAQSLLSVSQIQNLPLSAPARSVCHANPSLPLPPLPPPLLALSLSLSLACLLASFLFPFLSLFSFCHPLTCLFFFLSLSHSLLPFPLPPAFCFAAMPLPAHLFCLFSSPPPPPPLSPR